MSGRFFDIEEHAESTRAERSEEWLTELTTRCHSLLDDFRDGIQHVRVAILDTGIDSAHPEIARRIGKYNVIRDVVDFTEGSPRRTFPETGLDKAGHGTHVASLLIRVAPNAGVYVGRICKDTSGINADHVAAAINYAITEWKVDIISMSFGFQGEPQAMKFAIRDATNRGVLLFAAASNHGINRRQPAFPARYADHVICVNSFISDGTRMADSNPAVTNESIGTLGVEVPGAWPGHTGRKVISGTSVATPILAGIAALTLQFVRQMVVEPPADKWYIREMCKEIERIIGERRTMVMILKLFSESVRDRPCRFIQPRVYSRYRGQLSWLICFPFLEMELVSSADVYGPREVVEEIKRRSEKWLCDLEDKCHTLLDTFTGDVPPVRVAILDTGVDTSIPEISAMVYPAEVIRDIVDFTGDTPRETFPEGSDYDGNGSNTTSILARVAPKALIYVGRISRGLNNISSEAVAMAIRHAVQVWKVDIISMSSGFRHVDNSISKAVQEAASAGILLFTAASISGGGQPDVAFPACDSHVIGVNAFSTLGTRMAKGNPSSIADDTHSVGTLGTLVTRQEKISGTHVATPVLAGIAALSIQFVRQSVQAWDSWDDEYDTRTWEEIEPLLKERWGMMLMLELLSEGASSEGLFVQPQMYFDSRAALQARIQDAFQPHISPPSPPRMRETHAKGTLFLRMKAKVLQCSTRRALR